jgi:hypothetical protein
MLMVSDWRVLEFDKDVEALARLSVRPFVQHVHHIRPTRLMSVH